MSAKCTIHWLCDFLHADLLVQGILDLIVCAILGFWEVCSWLYREGGFPHTLHWLMIFPRTWSMTKKTVTTNLSAIILAISPKTFFFTADHVLMVNVNYRETFHVWGNVPLNRCWWRPMLALDLLSLFTTAAAVEDIGHHLLLRTPACPLFHNQVHFSTLYLYLYLCLYFVLVTKFQINWYRRQPFLSKCLIRKMWKGVD